MHKLYQPNFLTVAVSTITLGLYIGVPHVLLGLFAASFFSRAALIVLALLVGSLFLPAKPLRIQSVLSSYLFLCWRRYFKFSYLFERSLDCYQDYVIAQFPHGAFPLGCILGGTFMATEYPEYYCYAMAAPSAFLVPIWRHVHAWLGTETCTKTHFHHLLGLGVQGPLKRHSASGLALEASVDLKSPFAAAADGAAGSCADSAADDHGHHPGRSMSLNHVGSVSLHRRRSLAGSLRATFKQPHSLSDTESSDSDSEPCSSPAAAAAGGPGCRFSIGSNNSSLGESVAGSACSCTGPCSNCCNAALLGSKGLTPAQPHSSSSSQGWVIDPATGKRKTGVSVGLMVGGIAEMFMIRKDHERIKLRDRKGFVRIALEHGTPILPVYMFGANQVLDFGPPWLQRLSRKMRASVGIIYGRWGLPVPRRVPIFQVTGRPLPVGPPMRKDHPDFQKRVDELHAEFICEIERLYYTHRGKYGHGFENRPLVIS
eukprot:GHUV01004035.1.p1 GENE.GHUV01004035.1~~GHUV01004035.1.p1  ORF type:complete len:485 (+),score=77.48 GHUV01004035.1:926-2380(+)